MRNDTSTNPDHPRVGARPAARWNAVNRGRNPFTDHRFLAALEDCGCVGEGTGWQSAAAGTTSPNEAFAPAWIKHHSHGEFVFDFAWAEAAHRSGLRWFPKLLVAVPLTPVTGPRLLGGDDRARAALVDELEARVNHESLSSCAINFCDAADREILDDSAWLSRGDWQFHWFNRGYENFDDFLGALRSKPRKNIRRERRLARADGWDYRWVDGERITDDELRTVHACYRTTFMLYRNLPALNEAFFARCARAFGDQFLVCFASRRGEDLACSVFWKSDTRLYGRYWGALTETRDVHFEACYYQGIEYCIDRGLQAFEPGAQGEHKIRRGFRPVRTHSYHYVRHPVLREGIRRWLEMERRALDQYREELREIEPFREHSEP
ncbi:MAG: GNAT family N-acetyltransferase [Candidatus Wenzhouxiangella sp. M2_3B_020]